MIGLLFMARAWPGFAFMGDGLLAVSKGTYNSVQVFGIAVGLVIVALAGVFTIRSNVAKIWREQAEGEKARNEDLTKQLGDALKLHATELANARLRAADELTAAKATFELQIGKLKAEAEEQRALKHTAINERDAANMRTDLGPLMKGFADLMSLLGDQHKETLACLEALNAKEAPQ